MLKDVDAFPLKMKNELHALGQLLFFNPYSAHFEQLKSFIILLPGTIVNLQCKNRDATKQKNMA